MSVEDAAANVALNALFTFDGKFQEPDNRDLSAYQPSAYAQRSKFNCSLCLSF